MQNPGHDYYLKPSRKHSSFGLKKGFSLYHSMERHSYMHVFLGSYSGCLLEDRTPTSSGRSPLWFFTTVSHSHQNIPKAGCIIRILSFLMQMHLDNLYCNIKTNSGNDFSIPSSPHTQVLLTIWDKYYSLLSLRPRLRKESAEKYRWVSVR